MKLWSLIALSVAAALFQVGQADSDIPTVFITYFEGQHCNDTDTMGTWPNNGPFGGICLGYTIPLAGSFQINNCSQSPKCECAFYSEPDCTGLSASVYYIRDTAANLTGDCADTASTIEEPQSVKCWLG
ncbi:hypothetical protein L208DRAFT_1384530 [Tricholoma matsutake]|nr:hypothetical protein L208DRAFT_1384530 [Tricholoma matsutake 945]